MSRISQCQKVSRLADEIASSRTLLRSDDPRLERLRAEMNELARLLPAPPKRGRGPSDEAIEAAFDNMPV